ncbi:hypothetical protein chiPu_0002290 [Chiloscyllium punctatum]|uniref:Uncharacterized protein n=1 Tax=Chiloscyllium punctatum TaxID=137246 RepID=A0A401S0G8_CHIPU|nr:hypothetical protein [Chiloscyllium punctatum]
MPSLVRTPDRHSPQQPRTPDLKQSDSLSLRVAGLQARATTPGELQRYSIDTSTQRHKALRMMSVRRLSVRARPRTRARPLLINIHI